MQYTPHVISYYLILYVCLLGFSAIGYILLGGIFSVLVSLLIVYFLKSQGNVLHRSFWFHQKLSFDKEHLCHRPRRLFINNKAILIHIAKALFSAV